MNMEYSGSPHMPKTAGRAVSETLLRFSVEGSKHFTKSFMRTLEREK